jgi:hypothetical protein
LLWLVDEVELEDVVEELLFKVPVQAGALGDSFFVTPVAVADALLGGDNADDDDAPVAAEALGTNNLLLLLLLLLLLPTGTNTGEFGFNEDGAVDVDAVFEGVGRVGFHSGAEGDKSDNVPLPSSITRIFTVDVPE